MEGNRLTTCRFLQLPEVVSDNCFCNEYLFEVSQPNTEQQKPCLILPHIAYCALVWSRGLLRGCGIIPLSLVGVLADGEEAGE